MALVLAIGLFGLGLAMLVDAWRFDRRWAPISARVLGAEQSVERSLITRQNDRGNFVPQRLAVWKTRYEYEVAGRRYGKEDKISWPPGERLAVWYDRKDPSRSRVLRTRSGHGWIFIGTGLIPLGFWAIEAFDLLP